MAITATFGNQTVKNIPVSVTARTLSSFTIILNGTIIPNGGTVSLTSGQQTPFTVTANYSGGFTQDVTADTTWATRDGNIAILADSQNQPGQVIGVGSGTTTLTVSFGGQTSTVTLNVP